MFTGIVVEKGRIADRVEKDGLIVMTVEAPTLYETLEVGASISVSGVCLTVTLLEGNRFRMDVSNETARRTHLGHLRLGGHVNLELPLRADDRLGGHFVQGHVDGLGKVVSFEPRGGDRILRVEYPSESDTYVVEKGSIAVDGVSLTIARCGRGWFEVMLIPHTLAVTTLGNSAPGDDVNLEYDILAKHLVRLAEIYWERRSPETK